MPVETALEVATGRGKNLMDDSECAVPLVDLFAVGCSCTDVSAMNVWKDQWEQRLDMDDGSTAHMLRCALRYIDVRRPFYVLMENVPAFAVRGGARLAYQALAQLKCSLL